MTRLSIGIVARGGTGEGVEVGDGLRVIGRAREADLVLADPRVSRRHLLVHRDGEAVHVEVCPGAASFLLDGTPFRKANLQDGDTIVVGDTALSVTRAPDEAPEHDVGVTTDVGALMTGLAADVRGLAAVMALVEALDPVASELGATEALRAWAAIHLGATHVEITAADVPVVQLSERAGIGGTSTILAAAMEAGDPRIVSFTCPTRPEEITQTARRLLIVATRLCGSSLARVRSLRNVGEERDAFRQQSVGSARTFLGYSAPAREVARLAMRLATSDAAVLLEGETGSGKTFLARMLHEGGPRAREPLRIINCAAIPATLIESELFGYERGAFTGAVASTPGALEAAEAGTVLLDEVGELPLASQAKLLRVLEEKRFERLGARRSIALRARVIVATNRDLSAMAAEGTFRRDLYYRVAVVKLRVPALRERDEDLVELAARFLADLAPSSGRRVQGFSPAAIEAIRRYPWPGNVRELRNVIERALLLGDGPSIEVDDLPREVVAGGPAPQPEDDALVRLPASLEVLEARAIEAALRATDGNRRRAALLLGINRATLQRKLRETR